MTSAVRAEGFINLNTRGYKINLVRFSTWSALNAIRKKGVLVREPKPPPTDQFATNQIAYPLFLRSLSSNEMLRSCFEKTK